MKLKYKKTQLIISVMILLFIIELCFINYCMNNDIKIYKKLNGVIISDNIVQLLVDDHELKILYSNKYVYIKNKRYKKEEHNITKKILKRREKYYHYISLNINLGTKYKMNDIIPITVYDKKEKIISIFKILLKEGK